MFEILFGALLGFLLFTLTSHPKSRISKKLPDKKIKNLQVFPRVTISAKNRVFHFHHWIMLTPILLFFQNIIHSDLLQGLLIGSIFQGLLYKDRFKIIVKQAEHAKQVKNSSFHIPLIKRLIRK